MNHLAFTKVWTDPIDFPKYEADETQVRADMQLLFDEIKVPLNNLIDATTDLKTTTITTTWVGATGPYTQEVTVAGITAASTPIIAPVYSGTNATAILQKTAWNCIGSAITGADKITFTCFEDKPITAIDIQIKGM